MLRAGDVIGGKYTIERQLASGGQSRIFLAHTANGVRWAVKAFRSDGGMSAVARRNLITEINVLKRLEHPGLVRIADAVAEGDCVYMISEYVRGLTLEEIIRRRGAADERTVADIAVQLCDVLGYLHSRRQAVIYRDLKPSNIIRRRDGRIALIDFGTAHMGGTAGRETDGIPLGTHGYAAPEQYEGTEALSDATDVYALGKTMTALLTGGQPEVRPGRLRNVSAPMRKLIRRCIYQNPRRRYTSVAAVYYDLRHLYENRLLIRAGALLRMVFFAACAAVACFCFAVYFRNGTQTLIHGCAVTAACMVLWSLLDIPGAVPDLLGLSARLAVRRAKLSARVNGVFRIGRHMPTKQAISWRDIEIPLDEAMTDVRLGVNGMKVNVAAMKGFRIERDEMVTMRENYRVVG